MVAFDVKNTVDTVQITLDKKMFSEEEVLKMLSYLRIEFLAKKVDFDDSIEALADDIKKDWWEKNKNRFIKE